MTVYDRIYTDLTPGMRITIADAVMRYCVPYKSAQKALRRLWRGEVVRRVREGRRYVYEGMQGRLA